MGETAQIQQSNDLMSHLPFSSKLGRVNGCSRSALKISGISELMFCVGCKVQQVKKKKKKEMTSRLLGETTVKLE